MLQTKWVVSGTTNFAELIKGLRPSRQNRIVADGIARASEPVVKSAKSKVPIKTGALKRSLGFRVRKYPTQGRVSSFIGARRIKYAVAPTKSGKMSLRSAKKGEEGSFIMPSKYSHLVEFGHKLVKGGSLKDKYKSEWTVVNGKRRLRKTNVIEKKATGRTVGFVKGSGFLTKAVQETKTVVNQEIGKCFSDAIAAEYARMGRMQQGKKKIL